ncbi:hypothetical protein [Streptomyces griseosporeus]|uniref:hypothetical protein n=1 Tax=Streptomyces griseosporeus TaxID=1910 RepID=UPI0036F723E9
MTAPVTPRIPTPGDLARRTTTPAAHPKPAPAPKPAARTAIAEAPAPPASQDTADLIAPGRLQQGEVMWQMVQQGMRVSRMRPEARLVALTLLGYAHPRTGLLDKYWPSCEQIAYASGLTTGQVLVQLEVLAQRGWLVQRSFSQGPRQGQTVHRLVIPSWVLEHVRSRRNAHAR